MLDLLFFLLLGHYMGDFAFQTGRMAKYKPTSIVVLSQHVLVYTLTVAGFLFLGLYFNERTNEFWSWITLAVVVGIYVEHWFQDWVKGTRCKAIKQVLFLDQALHVLILYAIRLLIYGS